MRMKTSTSVAGSSGEKTRRGGVLEGTSMYSTARFTLVNSVEKNIQHLVGHGRELVATPGEDPVCRHFVQRAEEYLGDDVRVQIRAKDTGSLTFFKSRANQR